MAYDGWNLLGGYRLLGAALAGLLGGVMDFNTADGLGGWADFGTRECEGLRGSRGAGRTD